MTASPIATSVDELQSAGEIPARKTEIDIEKFCAVDMRAATIVKAQLNPKAKKPAYTLDIDLGPLGIVKSSAQLVANYTEADLVGRRVIAVVNLPPRKVAGVKSEVLVLANLCPQRGTVLLAADPSVANGSPVA